VREVFADNARNGAAVPASAEALADLPPGPFDVVALPFPRMSESLLMTDLLEAAHDALRVGGRLVAATDGNGAALGRAIENVFGKLTPGPVSRRGKTFFAERRREKPVLKDRSHVLTPEIRPAGGGAPIRMQIETRPGTFNHGSLDRGTRALLEWYVPGDDRNVLDLGAGCGAIGIYAALRIPEGRVTLVETNVRAAECARRNAARNGVADRTEAGQFFVPRKSLTGAKTVPPSAVDAAPEVAPDAAPDAAPTARAPRSGPGAWDCVLANPPYFSEMRIAREFCSTAHDALRAGGHIALVVRRGPAADLHSEVLFEVFTRVTTFDAGDYAILTARR
jgi:16S rRNA (guanine1207-N2)-methyltransferase